ncbi:hypothetical protein DIPPA_22188 [Diplonema papillatum]|nr:hypothetical protein DIPPA_22188 [Diplonema papillatum]
MGRVLDLVSILLIVIACAYAVCPVSCNSELACQGDALTCSAGNYTMNPFNCSVDTSCNEVLCDRCASSAKDCYIACRGMNYATNVCSKNCRMVNFTTSDYCWVDCPLARGRAGI